MRNRLAMAAAGLVALAAAGAGQAAPSVQIRDAVARVVVIPEARGDIQISIVRANPRLPLQIQRLGDRVIVRGTVAHKVRGCRTLAGKTHVMVLGLGVVDFEDMPQVVIHMPMDVRLSAGEAVFGAVGRTRSLDFANAGCGDWTLGNVSGPLRISQAGSGDTRAGSAGSADLRIAGSGDIVTQDIRDGLTAVSAGSGDITAASVRGPFTARVAGSGDIHADAGAVTDMVVAIAGSGDVDFRGEARNLRASVVGSGDVHAASVSGEVTKRLVGSGEVRVGP